MPALTASAVSRSLEKFIPPGEDILTVLNMVLPRLYAMGYWRDLLMETTIQTDHKYFVLPDGAESVVAAIVDNYPQAMRNQWHDYKIVGITETGPAPIFGIIDDGMVPVIIDPDRDDETYQLKVLPVAPETVLPSEGTITVVFENEDEELDAYEFTMNGSASITTALAADSRMIDVKQIRFRNVRTPVRFQDTPAYVEVQGIAISADGDDIKLATGRGDMIAQYHRYRFSNPSHVDKYVNLLCKRGFQPLISEADLVHLGDLNAIKHGMLATIAEDNADVERANYHWSVCQGLLENELDAYRGAARPVVKMDPTLGSAYAVPNLL